MKYYQVKPEYDGLPIYQSNLGYATMERQLIASELYTENERKRYRIPLKCLNEIEISQRKTYHFFGARFIL